ncbi:HAD family phosphatase [Paenibacillus mesophilus]|uniref:Cof-type HAD-IIB family hydrolase n=1 Tax=Paenibacillus mesophilus TaxID=2582849 RepID=UPI00110E40C8|nr:Cof-type HAD-IIB family hydrolase [Paenibacillus mesophilus]TMV52320.1 HAD family phosphatase [Paenibacillus mesophilus]
MTFRLIALDLDGTLLNKQKDISEENVKWIKTAIKAGMKFTLATGRPIRDVAGYAARLGIDCPLVVNNGSEVWETSEVLHSRRELTPGLIVRLFELLQSYGEELDFWAHTVGGKIDKTNIPADPADVQWLQFAFRSGNAVLLHGIRERLTSWNAFEISNSHITNIECNAVGVNKASGLREVCTLVGIDMSQVIAMGDSLNDIPMIREAGLGIAMGNAQQAVKEAADLVAPGHQEDGVARMIERHLPARGK